MILRLDMASDIPIYQQIRNQIVLAIGSGALSPGESLPTVRQLAESTGVNSMTVNKAYSLLKSEGYILIDRRSGAKVRPQTENGTLGPDFLRRLELLAAEAAAQGVSRETFLRACREAAGRTNMEGED